MSVTGLTLPKELETDAQVWFERRLPLRARLLPPRVRPRRESPHAVGRAGAGEHGHRAIGLDEVGDFDEALDAGTPTRSGGDHEMFSRILELPAIGSSTSPAALSRHRHRRTWEELRDTLYGYGIGVYAMWTRALVTDREYGVFKQAFGWLGHGQLPSSSARCGAPRDGCRCACWQPNGAAASPGRGCTFAARREVEARRR